ncbi:hypothetical protein HK097_001025 [Rhizophlyctis rosea]|uniref:SH3 domain-containing protein n=1 Tax=Rhizophlyctis rosea TaxID=64517 RepID=A0AAD5X8N8_9FUNG|nr:hypothetical protein HK097_001025 [Rhizophlyctis rosea]
MERPLSHAHRNALPTPTSVTPTGAGGRVANARRVSLPNEEKRVTNPENEKETDGKPLMWCSQTEHCTSPDIIDTGENEVSDGSSRDVDAMSLTSEEGAAGTESVDATRWMMTLDREKRPGLEKVGNHPWVLDGYPEGAPESLVPKRPEKVEEPDQMILSKFPVYGLESSAGEEALKARADRGPYHALHCLLNETLELRLAAALRRSSANMRRPSLLGGRRESSADGRASRDCSGVGVSPSWTIDSLREYNVSTSASRPTPPAKRNMSSGINSLREYDESIPPTSSPSLKASQTLKSASSSHILPDTLAEAVLDFAKVMWDFEARSSMELGVRQEELVAVLERVEPDDGRWRVRSQHRVVGLMPSGYLMILEKSGGSPDVEFGLDEPEGLNGAGSGLNGILGNDLVASENMLDEYTGGQEFDASGLHHEADCEPTFQHVAPLEAMEQKADGGSDD